MTDTTMEEAKALYKMHAEFDAAIRQIFENHEPLTIEKIKQMSEELAKKHGLSDTIKVEVSDTLKFKVKVNEKHD